MNGRSLRAVVEPSVALEETMLRDFRSDAC